MDDDIRGCTGFDIDWNYEADVAAFLQEVAPQMGSDD
jgi:hypothetical protein